MNKHAICETVKHGAATGIKLTKESDAGMCRGCLLGKSHRQPYPSTGKKRVSVPGKLMHVDLCGKMHVESFGRGLYFLLFKDDCSGYAIIFVLKRQEGSC